jgi:hypothetical protein
MILEPRRLVSEQPRRFDPRCMLFQPLVDRRERGDRAAELPALPGVTARRLERALREANSQGGNAASG